MSGIEVSERVLPTHFGRLMPRQMSGSFRVHNGHPRLVDLLAYMPFTGQ